MLNAVLNNRLALTTLLRAAWFLIDTGHRITALSGDLVSRFQSTNHIVALETA